MKDTTPPPSTVPQGDATGHAPSPTLRLVVMGVSGCGKSTIGRALAAKLGLEFVEGDELHPPQNIALMASGIALTDDNRRGWLGAIAERLRAARGRRHGLVVSCSALKRSYRDLLRGAANDLRFIHLHGAPELLASRLCSRGGHYMPASLLQSQIDVLEPPGTDEAALSIDIARSAEDIIDELLEHLSASST